MRLRNWSWIGWLALIGCGGGTLWAPMDGGRGDWLATGGPNGRVAVHLDGPTPPLELLWSKDTDSPPVGGALLAGSVLVQVGQTDRIQAFDLTDGNRLGRKGTDGSACGPGAIFGRLGELLVLPEVGKKDRLRAYDRRTRKMVWQLDTRACAPMAGIGDTVLAVTEEAQLLALASADGEQLWAASLPSQPTTGALVAGDVAIVGGAEGALMAVDLTDGSLAWQIRLGDSGAAIRGQAVASGGRVYAATADGVIWAVANPGGEIQWSSPIDGLPASGLSLTRDILIVGSSDRRVYALSTTDGRQLWSHHTGGVVRGAPASTPSTTYVGSSDGLLLALDVASGELLWRFELDAPVQTPIVLARDLLSVTTQEGTIYVFAAESALR
ncbi:MAG: PQQ-like beta-propeller repeat protein [Gemmatimonadetes bacterium]|jgi:outer membrane protein assembly factor BamB|nr:PQQ-like beta-propeller repeat protein [Gemmatimonadota bacterium]MBT6144099.1 PQQ-like beta-propeller repeat protein [Gemmatimonadota bacterium]MBT7862835.1 PQQ-like beta-propeller repeat protein [Gemmatimonadota bacterium]